jgi:hypothetical protein
MDIEGMVADLSDDELLSRAKIANDDCVEAANTRRNSEWHDACFAACVVFSEELSKRGLRLQPLH